MSIIPSDNSQEITLSRKDENRDSTRRVRKRKILGPTHFPKSEQKTKHRR